jgi:predicted RNase H-like HicB family nuclease
MNNVEFKASLGVGLSKQGSRYVAYSPALDISTSGKTEAEAKKRFSELVPLFFEELVDAGTLDEVLSELGWKKEGTKKAGWRPPHIKNEQVQVRIPVAA